MNAIPTLSGTQSPDAMTQKEAAAVCGVSVRQFIRYRHRYSWLAPVALTGLVPVFTAADVAKLREQVQKDKLSVLAAIGQRMRNRKTKAASVVSMAKLRAAKERAR